jgi:oligogalacturonide lyase
MRQPVLVSLAFAVLCPCIARSQEEPPVEWIDAKTNHRVVRLSREPGSASLYFHQYPYSADGKKLVFTAPSGIWTVDLESRELDQVVEGRVGILLTGRKTGDVYFVRWQPRDREGRRSEFRVQGDVRPRRDRPGRGWPGTGEVFAANLDTHQQRQIAKLPEAFGGGNVAVNADETMLVGIGRDPDGKPEPRALPNGTGEGRLTPGWSSGEPRLIYTIDIASGDVNVIHRENEWLNHLQCSPTDPGQILFCHEGPWHFVDRTWLIRTDGSGLTQVHPRTMDMEIGATSSSATTARRYGTTCRRRGAWCSGWPATRSPPANAPGTTTGATSGRSTTTSRRMASCSRATAAGPTASPTEAPAASGSTRPETVNGSIFSDRKWPE